MLSGLNNKASIAVIGIGCRYPGAANPKTLWENILARRRQFRRFRDERLPMADYQDPNPAAVDKTYGTQGAFIDGFDFDWQAHRIPRSTFEAHDIVHWLALDVALAALSDSGYESAAKLDRERMGVMLGNTLTGEFGRSSALRLRWPFVRKALRAAGKARQLPADVLSALEVTMEDYYKSIFPAANEDLLVGGLANTIAGRIANYLDLHGGAYVVDGACASSILAIATAANYLAQGDLDVCLAGGVDVSLDTLEMIGFSKVGALTKSEMRVYDKNASGFVPGEGCGFLTLKRLEDARRDGDYVYAVLRGWGIASDGKGGMTAPAAYGQSLALLRAYERAGYNIGSLDFIEGHGTGTVLGDTTEIAGAARALEESGGAPPRKIGMTSFKSLVGHCKAAAGIGGAIKAILALNQRVVPPTAGCRDPHPLFATTAQSLYPIQFGEIREPEAVLRAGISGMGFGGINSHLTIESGDAPSEKLRPSLSPEVLFASVQETEVFPLSADSISDLVAQVDALLGNAEHISLAEMTDYSAECATRYGGASSGFRAAVLASTPSDLVGKLKALREHLADPKLEASRWWHDPRKDIWVSGATHTRIAALFPGQGSQQLNMARTLVQRFSWARELVSLADQVVAGSGLESLRGTIYRQTDRAVDNDEVMRWQQALAQTEVAQPAIILASLLWLERLRRIGIVPAVMGGHSLGELAAFHAAGAYDQQTLLKLAAVRGQAMALPAEEAGAMASLRCGRVEAETLLAEVPGYAVVANLNAPQQTVVSGDRATIQQVVVLAKMRQIQAVQLNVSNAFHSRLVAPGADYLLRHAELPDRAAGTVERVLSSKAGAEDAGNLSLIQHFADHILAQVDFIGLAQRLGEKADFVIEVGPGQVLSGLMSAVVPGKIALPVESTAGSDRDFNRVLAACYTAGCKLDWTEVFAQRLVHPFVNPAERQWLVNPCERPFKPRIKNPEPIPIGNAELEHAIAKRAGIDVGVANRYLKQRRPFLVEVMSADLRSWEPAAETLAEDVPEARVETVVQESTASEADVSATVGVDEDAGDTGVVEFIRQLIADRTGFPMDSITAEMNMLDDLGLDSIKTAEVVGTAAGRFGVAEKIDPTVYAKATIQDVVSAINQHQGDTIDDGVKTPGEEKIEQTGGNHLPTWVRSFAMHPVPSTLAVTPAEDYWRTRSLAVLHAEQDAGLALELGKVLQPQQLSTVAFNSVSATEDLLRSASDGVKDFVVLMPMHNEPHSLDKAAMRTAIERLHLITQVPQAGAGDQSSVYFVQAGGGYFGLEGELPDPDNIAAMAFAASWHLERSDLRVRVIDIPSQTDVQTLARFIGQEAMVAGPWAAAGYDASGQRRVLRPQVLQPRHFKPRPVAWTAEDVIIVSGGGKGITAECALAFAQVTGVKMALVGSTALSDSSKSSSAPSEIHQTLTRFEQAGMHAVYYACDITDAQAVEILLGAVRKDLGEPTALFHGAAVNHPRRLDQTSTELAFKQVQPKVTGLLNLLAACDPSRLKLVVGFSSVIGVTGMAGSGWYGWSNEIMNLLLRRFSLQHPEVQIGALAYSVWEDVGMGVKGGGLKALARLGIAGIPAQDGVKRFLDIALRDPGVQQAVVTARIGGLDTWHVQAPALPMAQRFIDQIVTCQPGIESIVRTRLTVARDRYLLDHDYKGSLLFPTVFGLEAMSQVVALTLGVTTFDRLVIRDISLERPIVVGHAEGLEIEIHVELLECEAGSLHRMARATISTEQSAFSRPHFAATFSLDEEVEQTQTAVTSAPALPIVPRYDLYNAGLLFQGARFQRIEAVHELTEQHTVVSGTSNSYAAVAPVEDASEGPFMLGDPYFRDAQLQAGQLSFSQEQALPVEIRCLQINLQTQQQAKNPRFCRVDMTHRTDTEVFAVTVSYDSAGQVLERLEGYHTRIIDHDANKPSVAELLDPERRDSEALQGRLAEAAQAFAVTAPRLEIYYRSALQAMNTEARHAIEQQLITTAVRRYAEETSVQLADFSVAWRPNGGPWLQGCEQLGVSISHDERVCLICVGSGAQGCDVLPMTADRDWPTLLGAKRLTFYDDLQTQGLSQDDAGGAVWSAMEAALKAQAGTDVPLVAARLEGQNVLFTFADETRHCEVLALPLDLTRGPRRWFAAVCCCESVAEERPSSALAITPALEDSLATVADVSSDGRDEASKPNRSLVNRVVNWGAKWVLSSGGDNADGSRPLVVGLAGEGDLIGIPQHLKALARGLIRKLGYASNMMGVDGTLNAIRDQVAIRMYFPVSMKEAANLSKTAGYANFVHWFGKTREVAFQPLGARMVEQFASMQWGMVTNFTETRMFREATFGEMIEVLFWANQISDSSVDAYAFWRARLPDGTYRPLALSRQMSSWVAIVGHGLVEPRPLPDYVAEFFGAIRNTAEQLGSGGLEVTDIEQNYDASVVGRSLYRAEVGPGYPGHMVASQVYETDQTDSNVVGNLYFACYTGWQASLVDRIVQRYLRAVPGAMPPGELRGRFARVNHLREAMPFDKVEVKVLLAEVFERGVTFNFEYFKLLPNGGHEKIATAVYTGAWFAAARDGQWYLAKLPAPLLDGLVRKTGIDSFAGVA